MDEIAVNARGIEQDLGDELQGRIVESIDDGIYFVDLDRRIRYWTAGAERITGYTADEMIGRGCPESSINHVDEDGGVLCGVGCPLAGTIRDGRRRQVLMYVRHRDGHRVPVRARTTAVRDLSGAIVGATEVFSDETPVPATRLDIDELRRLAFEDQLTGLPNRTHAERVLVGRLASLERRGWPFGLLVADLDNFKLINDRNGHLAGDDVLRAVGRTMLGASRPEDFVARWGGDEFVVIVAAADRDALLATARRVRGLVARTHVTGADGRLGVSISMGGTTGEPGDTIESLFARADRALYEAKQAGRNVVRFVEPGEEQAATGS